MRRRHIFVVMTLCALILGAVFKPTTTLATTQPVTTATAKTADGTNYDGTNYNGTPWTTQNVTITLSATDSGGPGVQYTDYMIDAVGGPVYRYSGPIPITGEGWHTITYWSVDSNNVAESFKYFYVKIDRTNPSTTASGTNADGSNYTQNTWTKQSVTLTLSASDSGSGVQHTYYETDGSLTQTYSNPFTITGEGRHYTGYWSVDNLGHTEPAQYFWTYIDKTAPTTTANYPSPNGSNGWYTSAVPITLNATDPIPQGVNLVSGVGGTFYRVDTGGSQQYSGTFNFSTNGTHTITYWSVDNAGNVENSHSFSLKVDLTAPVTTATGTNADGSSYTLGSWTNQSVRVSLSAADNTGGSGLASTYFVTDLSPSPQSYSLPISFTSSGQHVLTFWSTDNAGNVESNTASTNNLAVNIDRTAPTTSIFLPTLPGSGWYNSSLLVTLSANDTGGAGVATTYYKIDGGNQQTYNGAFQPTLSSGTHTITFWSKDNAGNVENNQTPGNIVSFKIDATPPTTTASYPTPSGNDGWYTGPISVGLNASDDQNGSGVAATYYTIDGTQHTYTGSAFSVSGDGTHTITYWSVDVASNTESHAAGHSFSVKIDSTPPTTAIVLPTSQYGWYNTTPVPVSLSPSDTLSGVKTTYYTVDGGAQQTYSGQFNVSGEQAHTVTYWSVDNAGNTESTNTTLVGIDMTPPSTTGVATAGANHYAGGWTNQTLTITLTGSDALSGIAHTYYTVDSGSQQAYAGPFPFSLEGSHIITFWSVDKAGNVEDKTASGHTISTRVDLTAPVTTASVPAPNTNGWYNAQVPVTLGASDGGSGLAVTYYAIDGGQNQPYTAPGPIYVSGDGIHTVNFYSTDRVGNIEDWTLSSNTITIKIDTTAPTISASQLPAANSYGWNNTAVTVSFTCGDPIVNKVASGYVSCPASHALTGEGAGQSWSGTVYDHAGNQSSTTYTPVNIDLTPPTVSYSGNAGKYGILDTVNITCTASDALSGIDPNRTNCQNITGPADTFTPGLNSFSATAHDKAGNEQGGQTSFTVKATFSSLCTLTKEFANDTKRSSAFCNLLSGAQKAAKSGNTSLKNSYIAKYRTQVTAQSGLLFSPGQATELIAWVNTL